MASLGATSSTAPPENSLSVKDIRVTLVQHDEQPPVGALAAFGQALNTSAVCEQCPRITRSQGLVALSDL